MEQAKILIAATNCAELFDPATRTTHPTGVYLCDYGWSFVTAHLTLGSGGSVIVATPNGGVVAIDPASCDLTKDSRDTQAVAMHQNKEWIMPSLASSVRLKDVDPDSINAVFMPGGYGGLKDLAPNQELAKIASNVYTNNGVIMTVGYGAAGLLLAKKPDGAPLVQGLIITGVSCLEEKMPELVSYALGDSLEGRIKSLGGIYSVPRQLGQEHVLSSYATLFTAANTNSVSKAARMAGRMLKEKLAIANQKL